MPLPNKHSFDDVYGYQHTQRWAKILCKESGWWERVCDALRLEGAARKQLPNIVTTCNLFFTFVVLGCLYLGAEKSPVYYVVGVIALVVRQYLDMMDGSVARVCDMKSRFGNYYDHVSDAAYVLGLLTLFVYLTPPPGKTVAAFLSGLGFIAFVVDIVNVIEEKDVTNDHINDNLMILNVMVYLVIVGFVETSKRHALPPKKKI